MSVLHFLRINVWLVILILIGFFLIIDLYSYKGIRTVIRKKTIFWKKFTFISFWTVSVIFYFIVIFYLVIRRWNLSPAQMRSIFYVTGAFFLIYIPKIIFIVFHIVDDIFYLIRRFVLFLINRNKNKPESKGDLSRRAFLTRAGIVVAGIPFFSAIYGMAKGRFDFRVISQKLYFKDLPESFNGLKIVQLSDIHIGSFYGFENEVTHAIELVNAQSPDYIFFTGDLVNYFTNELDGWLSILGKLKAKNGIYSILGNHDYGDYYHWKKPEDKVADHQRLLHCEEDLNFRLLRNEHVRIEKNNESIVLAGVENWGHPPYHQYGDVDKAIEGTRDSDFIVLLSHDPTYWDAKILGMKNIKLTLSGHTHGMQMGIKFDGREWSPASYVFRRWAGLYIENDQSLYVNRGFGYIGIPTRMGMPPEITVIELFRG
jgi:uncharacterized protein